MFCAYGDIGRIHTNYKENSMSREKVIIFGAGNCGRLIGAQILRQDTQEILAFIDNDPQKSGKKIMLDFAGQNAGDNPSLGGGGVL